MSDDHGTRVLHLFFVVNIMFNFMEHPELKLSSHGRKMAKFDKPAPEIEGHVAVSGLSPSIACSLDTGDRGLMFAFVECW